MEAPVARPLLTAEEYWRVCGGSQDPTELVDGRVVQLSPAGPIHSRWDGRLARRLGQFVEERRLGEVFPNCGFVLRRDPDLVRGPDLAFVSAERIVAHPPPEQGFWETVPDLVVEVVSPHDTADEINEKVEDYVTAGVARVWVLYPRRKRVHVRYPNGDTRILREGEVLEGEDVVPGFSLSLRDFWGG